MKYSDRVLHVAGAHEESEAEVCNRGYSMNIIPVNDRILIKPIEAESTTHGGIVLTSKEAGTPKLHGEVLAVGTGNLRTPKGARIPIEACKVGDIVIYGNVANTVKDTIDGAEVHLVVEQAIIGLVIK